MSSEEYRYLWNVVKASEKDGDDDVKGVVLLLYGTGNAPSNQPHFTNWLLKLKEQGIPVIAVSQVVRGTVALADYAAGAQLLSLDLISAGDMTAEAATTKLSYLLGKGYTQEEIAKAFGKSMRDVSKKFTPTFIVARAGNLGESKASMAPLSTFTERLPRRR
mmetsp:Transcript_7464/g.6849  ORF Transcript_7464/g.6849 Transcript_7464/m.6849 type:complete len:162 (+) Transcript_7464:410-895(+)